MASMVTDSIEQMSEQETAATIPIESDSLPDTMEAIVYRGYGGPEQLVATKVATPKPRRGKLIIRVRATSVNPIDCRLRAGEMRWLLPGGFPRIPGYDIAGEVAQCDASSGYNVGDRVVGYLDHLYGGASAEYARCSRSSLTRLPDSMSFEDAAAIPLAGSTALQALRDKATIKPGDRVLINGASGGVGAFAVQIAKIMGAHVTGVASERNESLVRSLGADDFIDYRTKQLHQLHRSWHVIFDVAGKLDYLQCRHLVIPNGTFVSTEPDAYGITTSLVTKLGIKPRYRVILAKSRGSDLANLIRYVVNGQMRVIRDNEELRLKDAAEAHRRLKAGGNPGKITLTV